MMGTGIVLNCAHCGRPIIGTQVTAGGFFYHFECARSPYAGGQPSPGCVSVPKELLERLTTPLSNAENRVLEQTDRLSAISELRALLQREG